MARGILLDSSVVIPHLRGRFNLTAIAPPEEPLFLPLTALGELYKGVFRSTHPEKSNLLLENFLQIVAILNPDTETARQYARISAELDRKGTPIPENDIWIAAVALDCDLPLAARDAHFDQITGLTRLNW